METKCTRGYAKRFRCHQSGDYGTASRRYEENDQENIVFGAKNTATNRFKENRGKGGDEERKRLFQRQMDQFKQISDDSDSDGDDNYDDYDDLR